QLSQPPQAFARRPVHLPDETQAPGEPKTDLGFAVVNCPSQHRADIRILVVQLSRCREAPRAANVGLMRPCLSERQVVHSVSPARGVALIARDQMLLGILSNWLEQVIPCPTLALLRDDQRFVYQVLELI